MFNAVYVNFSECYGPEGSLPLRQALEALLGTEDVGTYRNDGFVTVHCPVTDESYFLYDGCAVTRGPDGRVIVLEDIEQHEAFKQEVSKVMTYIKALYPTLPTDYDRFIIPAPKPDPLVAALEGVTFDHYPPNDAKTIRAALKARGLEIVEVKNDDRH